MRKRIVQLGAFIVLCTIAIVLVPNWAWAGSTTIVIERFVYDGTTATYEGDEYVKLYNMTGSSIDISAYKVGDADTQGETGEGMYSLQGSIAAGGYVIVAKNAAQFYNRWGFYPDFELITSGTGYSDTTGVPDLSKYTSYATGNWGLGNDGDNIQLLDSSNVRVDSVAWSSTASYYSEVGLASTEDFKCPSGSQTKGLRRKVLTSAGDTDNMYDDFANDLPNAITLSSFSVRSASTWPFAWPLAALAALTLARLLWARRRRLM